MNSPKPPFLALGLNKYHHYFNGEAKRAFQFCRVGLNKQGDGWLANHADLYHDAFLPLATATSALHGSADSLNARTGFRSIDLVFPIVVVRAPIYFVDATSRPPTLESVEHVCLLRSFAGKHATGTFIFDVMRQPEISHYYHDVATPLANRAKDIVLREPHLIPAPDGPGALPDQMIS
jgi:hypothetical protein